MLNEPTVRKSLEFAVEAEKIGARFYERAAGKFSTDSEVVSLCRALAQEERLHQATFERLLKTAPADVRDHQFEKDDYLRAMVRSEFFSRRGSFKDLDDVEGPADMLAMAVAFEKDTLLYYLGLREVLGTDALDSVIAEEKKHIIRLTGLWEQLSV